MNIRFRMQICVLLFGTMGEATAAWGSSPGQRPSIQLAVEEGPKYEFELSTLPASVAQRMRGRSWRPGCPVSLDELAFLRLTHWGMDRKPHLGELVVARSVAREVVDIFRTLFDRRFPIEKTSSAPQSNGASVGNLGAESEAMCLRPSGSSEGRGGRAEADVEEHLAPVDPSGVGHSAFSPDPRRGALSNAGRLRAWCRARRRCRRW